MPDFDGVPLVVGWELTLACNLQCLHCGSSAKFARPDELTLEESVAICDQFQTLLVREVDFTGGEPLLRRGWAEIATRLVKKGISTNLLTNGLLLDQDKIAEIEDAGIGCVGISLDGLEGTHDYIRGHEGLFNKVLGAIERTHKSNLRLSVITTACGVNLDELPLLLDLLLAMGVRSWRIQPLFHFGRSTAAPQFQLTDTGYAQIGAFIQSRAAEANDGGLDLRMADSLGYFTDYDIRSMDWRGCPAGLVTCGITSDGKIKGCLSLPDDFVEGDLREKDLWDIWFADGAFAFTRGYSADELGPNCRSCGKAEVCRGGCTAMSYGYTGRFHNDPYCFLGMEGRNI